MRKLNIFGPLIFAALVFKITPAHGAHEVLNEGWVEVRRPGEFIEGESMRPTNPRQNFH